MKVLNFKFLISFFFIAVLITAGAVQTFANNSATPGTVAEQTAADSPVASVTAPAAASATALQPVVTETGLISLSADALGTTSSGNIQVNKPAGATVRGAYMAAADVWGSNGNPGPLPDGAIELNGTPVSWSLHVKLNAVAGGPNHAWADVTSIVKPVVDAAPAGIIDLPVVETIFLDGSILAVIFDDPNQTVSNTVVLMFGAQDTTGDTFNVLFSDPIDKSDPNLGMEFSLGISFGFQPSGQVSRVDINGQRLTSSAGGQDDGYSGNGGLITVGGIGDSTANPPDPNAGAADPRDDDELYDILPFVNTGDTGMVIDTINPSNDDSIFFAGLSIRSAIAVVGEGIVLGPTTATNPVGTQHTVTATVQDDNGAPVVGRNVFFSIVSGPHAGLSSNNSTDANGHATFTYTGSAAGTDVIEASFVDSTGQTKTSNQVTKIWESTTPPLCPCPDAQACYSFDEGSGNVAGDSSGNGNDGTINGASWTGGRNGSGLSFDGVDDNVSIPVINSEEVSLSAWFYKNANDTKGYDFIFDGLRMHSNPQLREGFGLKFLKRTPDVIAFALVTQDASGNKRQRTASYNMGNSVGGWNHVAGTYNKTTGEQKLYVNGQLVRTVRHKAGNTVVPLTYYSDTKIGNSLSKKGCFNGIIDEVCLSNRALTDQEVQDIFNN